MTRLFGTDGIRGRVNIHPMTCETALKAGRAAAFLARNLRQSQVVIGKDTRISGDMLEAALAAGSGEWVQKPDLPYAVSDLAVVSFEGRFFALGGQNSTGDG